MACNVVQRYPNINVTGTFTPQGLSTGGLITEVTLNAVTWTALPASPLLDRNTLSVINQSPVEVKINHSNAVAGYVGAIVLPGGGERSYPVKDTIIIWAKCEVGTCTVLCEELA